MSEWQEIKLGGLIDINQSSIGRNYEFENIRYYDISSIGTGVAEDPKNLSISEAPSRAKRIIKDGDTILATVRPGNRSFYYFKQARENDIASTGFAVISPKNNLIDNKFLYYLISAQSFTNYLVSNEQGATYPAIKPSVINRAKINLPPLPTQQKIAKILSNYDDLIENNLKRIKLLEESARLTYEEWFLRFRIDGKKLEIDPESGLPFGWEKVKLKSFCILTMGQSPKSEFYNQTCEGLPFHQGVTNYGFRFPSNTTWSTEGSRIAEEGDILFSVRAPVGRLNASIEKIILGRGLASIRQINNLNSFLFYQLQNIFFEDNLMGSGAIFDSVTKRDVEDIELIYSKNISEKFNTLTSTIDNEIKNLTNQNKFLKEARDILLPRLMTCVIDTDDMDIAV